MSLLKRSLVWLSRIHHCRGFGIQSPVDYAFVRYVINEHWPYYSYALLPDDGWLTRKLGRLYFRLSNWRQPKVMQSDSYQRYWQAGCRKTVFRDTVQRVELGRTVIEDCDALWGQCDEQSVLVVEGIHRDWQRWHAIEQDERTGTTFDLYYCGIVFFEKNRYNHHYIINF